MTVYKFSNVSGFKNYQKYNDFLAGNPAVIPDKGSMYPLGVFTLASTTTDVTFSNIPQTYTHLQIRYIMRNGTTTSSRMRVQLNSDTGSNYAIHVLEGGGSSAIAAAGASQTHTLGSAQSASTSTGFSAGVIDILDYRNTNKNTTLRSLAGVDNNGSGDVSLWSGLWINTAAVNTIRLFIPSLSFGANSSFALYGIQA